MSAEVLRVNINPNYRRLSCMTLLIGSVVGGAFLVPPQESESIGDFEKRPFTLAEQRAKLAPHRESETRNGHSSSKPWSRVQAAIELPTASSIDQVIELLPPGCGVSLSTIEASSRSETQSRVPRQPLSDYSRSIQQVSFESTIQEDRTAAGLRVSNRQQRPQSTPFPSETPELQRLPTIETDGPVFNGLTTPNGAGHSAQEAAWNPHARATAANQNQKSQLASMQPIKSEPLGTGTEPDPHLEIFSRDRFPSATECAACHKQIFDEWAISNHAYAAISPMFHKFEQRINDLSQGTIGYFCLRCHAPVATTMGLRRDQAIWDGPRVFSEGVTCVACHRVDEQYGKVNGERRMVSGDLASPIYGSGHGGGVAHAIANKGQYLVKTDPNEKGPGQVIHQKAIRFTQLSRSDFCISCHQVAVDPQIKLEVVWDQYRASPARRQGITCQDCHMGRVPGVAAGYSVGPTAVVNERVINPARKHSNHVFYGPGGSIAHPGLFPHNPDADRWTFNEWLMFDWRAGWGTDEFEDALEDGLAFAHFPEVWSDIDDRYDAREILEENFKSLKYKNELRKQVMENGAKIEGPFFKEAPQAGRALKLHYLVTNTNSGHNLPSGSLGAQPQVWLNVVLIGPDGQRVWESGHVDSHGDVADLHSRDVQAKLIPHDSQLFNLQTKFLTTNIKGTDREMPLPVNVDIDQIPFLRPGAQPVSVINHPPFIRMEAHSLPPLGSRKAHYRIPRELMQRPGHYRLSVRMRSRAEPIYFMDFVGATEEMKLAMNESITNCHEYSVEFYVR